MFRTNLVVHYQEHSIIYCITQFGTIDTIVLQHIMPCSWWWTSRFVRNMQSRQKLWNKTDYKNCASRWLLTHCNMMHGTHNATKVCKANGIIIIIIIIITIITTTTYSAQNNLQVKARSVKKLLHTVRITVIHCICIFKIIWKTWILKNYCPLDKNDISFLFTNLDVAIILPSILYIFVFTCKWPRRQKHVVIAGLDRPLGLQEVEASKISRLSANEVGKVVSLKQGQPLPSPPGYTPGKV